jgi:hypothetical protein
MSTGPAFEASEHMGEAAVAEFARAEAARHVRDGLPLRAAIDLVGYVAVKPGAPLTPPASDTVASVGGR